MLFEIAHSVAGTALSLLPPWRELTPNLLPEGPDLGKSGGPAAFASREYAVIESKGPR
jgi:hypothetical protein